MYTIKIMSAQNKGDSDTDKGFTMILVDAGDHFTFGHDESGEPIVTVCTLRDQDPNVVTYPLTGNAYVMSHTGKTVATYWAIHDQRKTVEVKLDKDDPDPIGTVETLKDTFSKHLTEEAAREALRGGQIGDKVIIEYPKELPIYANVSDAVSITKVAGGLEVDCNWTPTNVQTMMLSKPLPELMKSHELRDKQRCALVGDLLRRVSPLTLL